MTSATDPGEALAVFESQNDPVCGIDEMGTILYANEVTADAVGALAA